MKSVPLSSIECLESRIAPASIIDVIAKGGVLTLKSLVTDDGNEKVAISSTSTPGQYTIDPEPGTQLRFEGVVLADGVTQIVGSITKSISISLGAGADQLSLNNVNGVLPISVNLGAGNNKLVTSAGFMGSLTYKGGSDGDIIESNGTGISGKLSMDLGSGANSVTLSNLTVSGDVSIKGGAGIDTLAGAGSLVMIGGKYSAQLGEGNNSVNLATRFVVGRDFSITTGAGNDTIALNADGNLAVGGNLILNSGKGNDVVGMVVADSLHVGKNLSLISGGKVLDTDDVDQNVSASLGIHVGGKLSLISGPVDALEQSINAIASNLAVTGAVSMTGLAKTSSQTIFAGKTLLIGGATTLAAKNLGGTVFTQSISTTQEDYVSASVLQGAVTLTGGSDVTVTAAGDYYGAMKVTTATGVPATVNLGVAAYPYEARMHGALSIKADPKAPSSNIAINRLFTNGTVSILGGNGTDTVTVRDVFAQGAVSISTGAGADTVELQRGSTLSSYSQYLGPVTIKTGAEIDTLRMSGSSSDDLVIFAGPVTYETGPEADVVTRGTYAFFMQGYKDVN